jgi:cyclase
VIVVPAIDLLRAARCGCRKASREDADGLPRASLGAGAAFAKAGATRVHDRRPDGAFAGQPRQVDMIAKILAPRACRCRSAAASATRPIDAVLAGGAQWAVLARGGASRPSCVRARLRALPGARDRGGRRARRPRRRRGLDRASDIDAVELARRAVGWGAAKILYTDVSRDGLRGGPNVARDRAPAGGAGQPAGASASGGIGALDDLRALAAAGVLECVLGAPSTTACSRSKRRSRVLTRRIIPCLDVKDGRVVKGVQFVGLRDAGDPVEAAAAYDAQGADEICFLDITPRTRARRRCSTIVARTRTGCSPRSPSAAACARSRTCGDCSTPAPTRSHQHRARCRPELVHARRALRRAGDRGRGRRARAPTVGGWEVFTHGGRTPTGLDALAWCAQVVELGAGEILLTSMDRDGTRAGYDLELVRAVAERVSVPVVASGGVGELEHPVRGTRERQGRRRARRVDLPLR